MLKDKDMLVFFLALLSQYTIIFWAYYVAYKKRCII